MRMTFRWFGSSDPVKLRQIRQIPGMQGIVTALHDLPPGELWPLERLQAVKAEIAEAGLDFDVVESIPVHESIKLGLPERDGFIENYRRSIRNLGAAGVPVLCYNFMPVFDWTRTNLRSPRPDGSFVLDFNEKELARIDLSKGTADLPGWGAAYGNGELRQLLEAYRAVDSEQLWKNLIYFLEAVIPAAEESGVRMAIHPDDPPWPIFGLPRIITGAAALDRMAEAVPSRASGFTMCSGSFGADPANDVPSMIRRFRDRIHFAHCRNVRVYGDHSFHETDHLAASGSVDMVDVMKAYREIGYKGPLRPDHGPDLWGEQGRPGYGLYGRALGATYLRGLWDAFAG